ncbi:MFS transporter [Aliidiomarina quisquiliarum]|uniref:MFS transporter n=1 Tax=Aliidiomarina quisquiliarum TaxID=2938947 RepID=UPI00208E6253|nr:MFS transporter [Aliidiomarina quisquiliarum]MCO4321597.1 MFS transporter [Aliidiomarina quisquiliarum]
MSHFYQLLLAPLFPWIKAELGLSYAELGALMSVFFVASASGQALAGFVVDKLGARNVLFAGLALLATAAVFIALSTGYTGLAVGALIAGLGNSVFHPADFTLLNRHISPSRLAHAFSAHGVSGSLGYAAAPVFLVGIAQLTGSWRTAVLAAAVLAALVLLLLFFQRALLDDRKPLLGEQAEGEVKPHKVANALSFDFLKSPQVWMCFSFFFISSLALGGIQSFAPTALHELYGMPLTLAALAYTFFMLANAGGILFGGFAARWIPDHDRLIAISFLTAGSLAVLLGTAILPAIAALPVMALIGFGAGVANPSRDLMVRKAAAKGSTGRVYGVVYSGLDVGMAVAPVIFGLLMDLERPAWVFVLIGGFQFLAIFTALGIGGNSRKLKPKSVTSELSA